MHRPKRSSTWRVLALALTVGVYGIVLVFAAELSAAGTVSDPAPATLAQAAAAGPATADAVQAVVEEQAAESPLATLGLAAAALGVAGTWRAFRLLRRPRPRPVAVRPVQRRVTTPG
jgi:hypothetical protein